MCQCQGSGFALKITGSTSDGLSELYIIARAICIYIALLSNNEHQWSVSSAKAPQGKVRLY